MRLKYYLRGAGIGIIFATLVMTVSAMVHRYNITDEYIIREAGKLGMVMKEELKGDAGKNTETEESEKTEDSEEVEESESAEESEVTEDSTTETPSESETQTPATSEQPEVQYVTIVIASGDYARQVAEKVRDAGLVQDAEDFRKYIGQQGYGKSMFPGSYQVPVGSTYEEICQILIKRPGR